MAAEDQLLKLFQDSITESSTKKFTLSFTYEGKPYTTTFTLMAYETNNPAMKYSKSVKLENECIEILRRVSGFSGEIAANHPKGENGEGEQEGRCFSPLLRSNRTSNPKISSIDVLQTLKTKLSLLLRQHELYKGEFAEQHGGSPPKVKIIDEATKNNIRLSSFLLLRGEDAIYEKYGYESTNQAFPAFKRFIQSLTWGKYLAINPKLMPYYADRVDYHEYRKVGETTLLEELGKIHDKTLFTKVMNALSWEIMVGLSENEGDPIPYVMEDGRPITFTDGILETLKRGFIADLAHLPETNHQLLEEARDFEFMKFFNLNLDNGRWQTYDAKLVLTNLTAAAAGGRRTKKRNVRSKAKSKRLPSRK